MNLARSSASNSEFGEEEVRDIVIRGYSSVGEIIGVNYSSVQVEAREAIVPASGVAVYSIRIELSSGGDYPQTSVASISYREIDRFISALDKMSATNINSDRFEFTEVEYEIDTLNVIVFNNDIGSLMVAFSCEGVSVHTGSLYKIIEFQNLIKKAKDILEKNRITS